MLYKINDDGTKEEYAKYSKIGVDTLNDIFPENEKTSTLLKLKGDKAFRSAYNRRNQSTVVKKIFYDFIILVLNTLTEGGMLMFPGKTQANIAVKPLTDYGIDVFVKNGVLDDISLYKANNKLPVFKFGFGPGNPRKDRVIRVPKRITKQALKNAEVNKVKYTYFRKAIRR